MRVNPLSLNCFLAYFGAIRKLFEVTWHFSRLESLPTAQMVERMGRRGCNPESVKLTQVVIDSPPIQPCFVCLGAGCGDGLRQLAAT